MTRIADRVTASFQENRSMQTNILALYLQMIARHLFCSVDTRNPLESFSSTRVVSITTKVYDAARDAAIRGKNLALSFYPCFAIVVIFFVHKFKRLAIDTYNVDVLVWDSNCMRKIDLLSTSRTRHCPHREPPKYIYKLRFHCLPRQYARSGW